MFLFKGCAFTVCVNKCRVDPVGPVVIFVAKVTDVELNLSESFYVSADIVAALLARGSDFGALKK